MLSVPYVAAISGRMAVLATLHPYTCIYMGTINKERALRCDLFLFHAGTESLGCRNVVGTHDSDSQPLTLDTIIKAGPGTQFKVRCNIFPYQKYKSQVIHSPTVRPSTHRLHSIPPGHTKSSKRRVLRPGPARPSSAR